MAVAADIELVAVKFEDLLLGVFVLQAQGKEQLLQLRLQAARFPFEQVLGGLLGDGAAPLDHPPGLDVGQHGPRDAGDVDTEMMEKLIVLGGDQGVDKGFRQFFPGQVLAMDALEQNTDLGLAVAVIDRALPGEDVIYIGIVDLRSGVDDHEVIAHARADRGGEQQKEEEGDQRGTEEFEHIRAKEWLCDGEARRCAATASGTGGQSRQHSCPPVHGQGSWPRTVDRDRVPLAFIMFLEKNYFFLCRQKNTGRPNPERRSTARTPESRPTGRRPACRKLAHGPVFPASCPCARGDASRAWPADRAGRAASANPEKLRWLSRIVRQPLKMVCKSKSTGQEFLLSTRPQ